MIVFTFRKDRVKMSISTVEAPEARLIWIVTGPGPVAGLGKMITVDRVAGVGERVGVTVEVLVEVGVNVLVKEGVGVGEKVPVGVEVEVNVAVEV